MIEINANTTYSTEKNYKPPVIADVREEGFFLWRKTIKRLMVDYAFEWGEKGLEKRLVMKAGYEWNGASTGLAEAIGFRRDGYNIAWSMFHDRFYENEFYLLPGEFEFHTKTHDGWKTDSGRWRRSDADRLANIICPAAGMKPWKAKTEEIAVMLWPENWFK